MYLPFQDAGRLQISPEMNFGINMNVLTHNNSLWRSQSALNSI